MNSNATILDIRHESAVIVLVLTMVTIACAIVTLDKLNEIEKKIDKLQEIQQKN